jgi:hypothetical protein
LRRVKTPRLKTLKAIDSTVSSVSNSLKCGAPKKELSSPSSSRASFLKWGAPHDFGNLHRVVGETTIIDGYRRWGDESRVESLGMAI